MQLQDLSDRECRRQYEEFVVILGQFSGAIRNLQAQWCFEITLRREAGFRNASVSIKLHCQNIGPGASVIAERLRQRVD